MANFRFRLLTRRHKFGCLPLHRQLSCDVGEVVVTGECLPKFTFTRTSLPHEKAAIVLYNEGIIYNISCPARGYQTLEHNTRGKTSAPVHMKERTLPWIQFFHFPLFCSSVVLSTYVALSFYRLTGTRGGGKLPSCRRNACCLDEYARAGDGSRIRGASIYKESEMGWWRDENRGRWSRYTYCA